MIRTVNFNLPSKWIDLSNSQLLFVSKLFLSDFAKNQYRFLTHALLHFSKCKIKRSFTHNLKGSEYLLRKKGDKPFRLSASQIHSVCSTLDFLLKEVKEVKPLRNIRDARPCHYRMYNTPFIRFLSAENFYTAYNKTSDIAALNSLVAALYLKPSDEFDDKLISQRSAYFRRVTIDKKYTVYLWYSGFRSYLSQTFPDIFDRSSTGSELNIRDHVMNMIRGLTEGDVTKNEMVQKVQTTEALYELNAKAKYINETNQKLKKK